MLPKCRLGAGFFTCTHTMHCRLPAENGVSVPHESDMPLELALEDKFRIHYLHSYLDQAGSLLLQCRHAQGPFLLLL